MLRFSSMRATHVSTRFCSQVTSHLSVTVYVEDINDHAPQFVDAPYHVTVDELTPVGETHIFSSTSFWKFNPLEGRKIIIKIFQ